MPIHYRFNCPGESAAHHAADEDPICAWCDEYMSPKEIAGFSGGKPVCQLCVDKHEHPERYEEEGE